MKTSLIVALCGLILVASGCSRRTAGASVFQIRPVAPEGAETSQPGNLEKITVSITNRVDGHIRQETVFVDKTVLLDGNDLKTTTVVTNPHQNQIEIEVELNAQGRKRFTEVTRQNLDKRLAIMIDGRLYSAPVIKAEITSGRFPVGRDFTSQEAKDLSDKINAALKQ